MFQLTEESITLQCACACLSGFLDAREANCIPLYALLDSEEMDNRTRQGTGGTFPADPTNRPVMNGASIAVFTAICKNAGSPVQYFSNRSDIADAGTLGCVSIGQFSVSTVDVSLAQLAMHSCFETTSSRDADEETEPPPRKDR